jgi:hypothetical protein
VVAALVVLALAGGAIWYFVVRDTASSNEVKGPSSAPFTLTKPPGWKELSAAQLAQLPGAPLAVIRKTDGTGVVIVNTQPPTSGNLPQLSDKLQAKLKQEIPDFKLVDARTTTVKAGQGISITYAREEKATVNTLVVVPAGGHLYTLNATVPIGAKASAQQVAQIISSFNA